MRSFRQTKDMLSKALKGSVDSTCTAHYWCHTAIYSVYRALPGFCRFITTSYCIDDSTSGDTSTDRRGSNSPPRLKGKPGWQTRGLSSIENAYSDSGGNAAHSGSDVGALTLSVANVLMTRSEYLRSVPDVLESLISEKRLLQAAVLLVRSLKLINKQDMLDIGALSDLRSDLTSQETVSY